MKTVADRKPQRYGTAEYLDKFEMKRKCYLLLQSCNL